MVDGRHTLKNCSLTQNNELRFEYIDLLENKICFCAHELNYGNKFNLVDAIIISWPLKIVFTSTRSNNIYNTSRTL